MFVLVLVVLMVFMMLVVLRLRVNMVALRRLLEHVVTNEKTTHTAESSVATSRGTWCSGLCSWCS